MAQDLIPIRCQCGAGLSVQESIARQLSSCPVCHTPLRLVQGDPLAPGDDFDARLILRSGPGAAGGQTLLGGHLPIEAGKLAGKHLTLAGTLVSRNHCRFVRSATGWRLVDDHSTNGSFVNGNRIIEHDLADGDVVRIGEYEFIYHDRVPHKAALASEAPATALPPPPPAEIGLSYEPAPARASAPVPAPATALAPAPATAPARTTAIDAGDAPDDPYELADDLPVAPARPPRASAAAAYRPLPQSPTLLPSLVCSGCNRTLAPGAKVCIDCGIDLRTGRPLITAHGLDEDVLYVRAENTIKVISFIIPFGLYPIASEAFGTRRPYVVWALALVTVLTSIGYWVFSATDEAAASDLMLWSRQTTPRAVTPKGPAPGQGPSTAPAAAVDADADADDDEPAEESPGGTEPGDEIEARRALFAALGIDGQFHWYQLITHAFIHADIWHLAGNLLFLLVFGTRVNALIGQWKTAAAYLVLALCAALPDVLFPAPLPSATLGASGAIMGLAGMYFVLFPVHLVHNAIWLRLGLFHGFRLLMKLFAVRGFWIVGSYVALDILYTVLNVDDNVAHWAHLAGFAGGAALAFLLLVARQANARGGDLFTVLLGKHAWPLVGKPRLT